ncbi:hypothetical protein [Guptibacillus hwajinpoensis]|uniref:Uncharacterized protein n=1 Tax=Guptibacillus hwajinpoensis TaxID=208199 RepID=A0ABU0JVI6_9BACL|nr:hypothetical protein [Alkalihalobacillus hemicentroti]MDQ0481079.1 hypothetical protein [Alkalihalobacillus hemicentroti]
MNLNEWKYRTTKNNFIFLENWMKFSTELSSYIKKIDQPIKMYVSVPSNLLFSYFFVLGAIDYDFKHPTIDNLLKQYLKLQKGQRILYKKGEEWVAHSVIKVSKVPNSDTRAIVVKDRTNCINYIPETRWFNFVRIHDEEVTKVRNTRIVRNVQYITDNTKLRNLYSEKNLNFLMMLNTPQTYLYANKKEWKEHSSIIDVEIGGEKIKLDQLLYDGTNGTFKNLSFIEQKQQDSVLPDESTIIFVGSSRALRKMDDFKEKKCVFIVDQHDSDEKYEALQMKIEQEFLNGKGESFNKEILDYMCDKQIQIPKGVEVFAWLSKS